MTEPEDRHVANRAHLEKIVGRPMTDEEYWNAIETLTIARFGDFAWLYQNGIDPR